MIGNRSMEKERGRGRERREISSSEGRELGGAIEAIDLLLWVSNCLVMGEDAAVRDLAEKKREGAEEVGLRESSFFF
ncbi:hypothetical protein L484_012839 [Morus notabilis]|uniref:Uncharacterized protein n=1 Tax=Morus notabilis TaxID=981085 RepID=W9R2R3_9ROSA|nr:hypothetical protein L484_012839 [Morus notabilis]